MHLSFNFLASIVAGVAAVGLATTVFAADIPGVGSTFGFSIYGQCAAAYQGASGSRLNYQSIGSEGGINQTD